MNTAINILLILVISTAISTIAILIDNRNEQNFVAVDITGILERHVAKYGAMEELEEQDRVRFSQNFLLEMKKSLKTLASESNTVVLVKGAVIEGMPDITESLEKHIDKNFDK